MFDPLLVGHTGHGERAIEAEERAVTKQWTFRDDVRTESAASLVGYDVQTRDGSIGEVTDESVSVDSSFIVVDTGFWILEKKRLIPASAIRGVDHDHSSIHLDMSKDEIKDAPDYVPESDIDRDPSYRDAHDTYYRPWFGVRP